MSQPKFCFNCGAPLAGGELFCSKCGKRLYASPPAPAAPVAPAVPNASTTAPIVANTPPTPSNNITLQQVGSALGSFFGAAAVAIHNAPPPLPPPGVRIGEGLVVCIATMGVFVYHAMDPESLVHLIASIVMDRAFAFSVGKT